MTRFLFHVVPQSRGAEFEACAAACGVHANWLHERCGPCFTEALREQGIAAETSRVSRSGAFGGCVQGRRRWDPEYRRLVETWTGADRMLVVMTDVVTGELARHPLAPIEVRPVAVDEFLEAGPGVLRDRVAIVLFAG